MNVKNPLISRGMNHSLVPWGGIDGERVSSGWLSDLSSMDGGLSDLFDIFGGIWGCGR